MWHFEESRVTVQGIIHRDLKGNNIFCAGGGILKLGDFGISKVLTPEARAARTMIGTPYYMSPEILKAGIDVLNAPSPAMKPISLQHSPCQYSFTALKEHSSHT